jgi:Raf kinase inhibitor-like YbhB/YbcL family protein
MLSRGFRCLMVVVLGLSFSWVVAEGAVSKAKTMKKAKGRMLLESPAFRPGTTIPAKFTCQGQDVSPGLVWKGEPVGTKSLAIVVEDPDASSKTWVHWVIFNIPPGVGEMPENMPKEAATKSGIRQGTNDSRQLGWSGPCPPAGSPHRYYFRLYALDKVLGLDAKWNKEQLIKAMQGHILAEAVLMGTYQRSLL